jgi:transposase InsO family protein
MSDDEIELLCLNLKLDPPAIDVISAIRNSPPVRLVRGGRNNVRGRYASRLMGVTIQFESHSCELPVIYQLEYIEADVREYYDQPYTFRIGYENSAGRKINPLYTPDFFVIRDTYVEFIECKAEEQLRQIAKDRPGYYVLGNDGQWRCPPVEKVLAQFGFRFTIISSADIDHTLYSNLVFLEDFLVVNTPSVDATICSDILQMFQADGRIALDELLNQTFAIGGTADDVYTLIAQMKLYVDLSAELLVDRKHVWVFIDPEAANLNRPADRYVDYAKAKYASISEGARYILNDGTEKVLRIVLVAKDKIYMEGEDGTAPSLSPSCFERLVTDGKLRCLDFESDSSQENEALRIINSATPKAIEKANLIRRDLQRHFAGLPVPGVPKRTLEYRKARWLEAERRYGSGYVGVIWDYRARGDRKTIRIQPNVRAEMNRLIEDEYENNVAKGIFSVYGDLVLWCHECVPQVEPPHYQTFCREIRKRPQHLQALKRVGHRAAYDMQPYYPWLEKGTPPHGTRPFEIAHIDHTPLEIELVDPDTGENLGKPTLTLMVDSYSRRILAIYTTLDPPSYRSNMMVIRECVRRWGRLPQTIVVDGGSDFRGIYFETLAAAFEITIKVRPASQPRFGSVIERLLGITQTEFVHLLAGNTKLRRQTRKVSRSHDPSRLAVWTMEPFDESFCDWAYNRYDTQVHETLKRSPRDLYESTIKRTGERRHRLLAFDHEFLILTMPSTRKGTAKVLNSGRVKIGSDFYRCEELMPLIGKTVEVRVDPLNIMNGYVRIKEKWVRCVCDKYRHVERMTERERKAFSEEERQRKRTFSGGLKDRALERALSSRPDRAKEKELAENRRQALLRKKQNEFSIKRVLGKHFEPGSQLPSATTTNRALLAATEESSLFASIDTQSIPSLAEYKG